MYTNMPDVLVFSTLVRSCSEQKSFWDLHDPMPELAMDIYGLDRQAGQVSLLRRLERWSIGFADLALTPNVSFKKLFVSRSCRPEKIQIVMNTPEETIFSHKTLPDVRQHPEGRNTFRIMHHGFNRPPAWVGSVGRGGLACPNGHPGRAIGTLWC